MSIDFRELTLIAIAGLNKKHAIRVGKCLDVAIAFGAIEHARGNVSLQDTAAVEVAAKKKLEEAARALPTIGGHRH